MKYILLMFVSLAVLSANSQTQKGYVYLKNGTVLKGKYFYTPDSSKLTIESAGNKWVFNDAEIDHVTNKKEQEIKELNEITTASPLQFHTELGVLAGSSENSQKAPFSFSAALNYRIFPKFSAGAGLGIEFLKETYMPAFLNLEYKFRNSASSPYLFLKSGYEIPLEDANDVYATPYPIYYYDARLIAPDYYNNTQADDTKGGFMINPGLGYNYMFSNGFGMSLAFGYQYHRLSYKSENDYQLDIDYNRLTIKLGFIF